MKSQAWKHFEISDGDSSLVYVQSVTLGYHVEA